MHGLHSSLLTLGMANGQLFANPNPTQESETAWNHWQLGFQARSWILQFRHLSCSTTPSVAPVDSSMIIPHTKSIKRIQKVIPYNHRKNHQPPTSRFLKLHIGWKYGAPKSQGLPSKLWGSIPEFLDKSTVLPAMFGSIKAGSRQQLPVFLKVPAANRCVATSISGLTHNFTRAVESWKILQPPELENTKTQKLAILAGTWFSKPTYCLAFHMLSARRTRTAWRHRSTAPGDAPKVKPMSKPARV